MTALHPKKLQECISNGTVRSMNGLGSGKRFVHLKGLKGIYFDEKLSLKNHLLNTSKI
tara:strand:- start:184 stop:357 length:174 start_codon:yes stop_codon:yes gene_type:complete